MDNNERPHFSKTEIICRLAIVVILFFIAVIGYMTLFYQKELKIFKILLGAILTLWSFRGENWGVLNKWVMRIGGISLLLSGIVNCFT
ncbi:MAG: hypothetical protein ABII25_09900 [bacterium]